MSINDDFEYKTSIQHLVEFATAAKETIRAMHAAGLEASVVRNASDPLIKVVDNLEAEIEEYRLANGFEKFREADYPILEPSTSGTDEADRLRSHPSLPDT